MVIIVHFRSLMYTGKIVEFNFPMKTGDQTYPLFCNSSYIFQHTQASVAA